jgi:hypothetical protein
MACGLQGDIFDFGMLNSSLLENLREKGNTYLFDHKICGTTYILPCLQHPTTSCPNTTHNHFSSSKMQNVSSIYRTLLTTRQNTTEFLITSIPNFAQWHCRTCLPWRQGQVDRSASTARRYRSCRDQMGRDPIKKN